MCAIEALNPILRIGFVRILGNIGEMWRHTLYGHALVSITAEIVWDGDISRVWSTLLYTTLHHTTLYYTTPHCTTLHCTALHYTTLHYTALFYTTVLNLTLLLHSSFKLYTQHYTALSLYSLLCSALLCSALLSPSVHPLSFSYLCLNLDPS